MKFAKAILSRVRASTAVMTAAWSLILSAFYIFKIRPFGFSHFDLVLMWAAGVLGIFFINRRLELIEKRRGNSEDAARNSDLLYHAIVETSPDSVLVTDLLGRFIFCSKQTAMLHKYDDPQDLIGKSAFKLFPLREIVRLGRYLGEAEQSGMIKNVEFNLLRKDGSQFSAELSASVLLDGTGTPFAFLAIVRDITERKWVEAQIRESEALYRVVADNTYDWEFWQAPNERFIYISPSCKRISGYDAIEFIRNFELFSSIVHPEDHAIFIDHSHGNPASNSVSEIEFRIVRGDDQSVRWISHVCQPVFDRKGKFLGTRGSNRDITDKKLVDDKLRAAYDQVRAQLGEIKKLQSILREQAIRDPLTGLYNRRYMEEALRQEHARAIREGHQISVVMLDMDELKMVNDTHGHITGDRALQILGEQLAGLTRVEDIACRYGGDEFLIILHNMPAKDAIKRVEQWRVKFSQLEVPHSTQRIMLTFTAGVASFPAVATTIEEIIHAADTALYKAKIQGRNNVLLFEKTE
jgi:diguanylate cyclase (GGDEF)-like protein/PAS domain S-box-containing protein